MPLPKAIRRLTPDRIRHDVRLRALAVGTGVIPPRKMHTEPEADLLGELADGRRHAVEIGVYEGSSTLVLARHLPADAVLHLIDPFIDSSGLFAGWRGTAWATRRVVEGAVRRHGGPTLRWHVERSQEAGRRWSAPVDLVFIDGDHSQEACRLDWELFSPWVTPGGVVVFHDARQGMPGGEGLPGPTATVDELFRGPDAVDGWRIRAELYSTVAVERLA
jgi:predicted O-methyltransferase YrrM